MSEQQSYEAFILRTYVRNYLDFENNFHIDVHRRLLFVKDLDATHGECLKDIKTYSNIIKDPNTDEINREQANLRLNAALEASQDLEQHKREIIEYLKTLIRNRKTSLDFDYNRVALHFQEKAWNLVSRAKDKETSCQQTSYQSTSSQSTSSQSTSSQSTSSQPTSSSSQQTQQHSAPPPPPPERTTEIEKSGGKRLKRARRSRATAGAATPPKKGNAKKKRVGKAGRAAAAQRAVIPLEDTVAIDPYEPTYCVCEQIAFGKMIMCDNDLCPMVWFHFSCVSVTTAPKGKWYCPKCRGTRPNVLKRRRLLLQELEKYNREMEEKASLSLNKE